MLLLLLYYSLFPFLSVSLAILALIVCLMRSITNDTLNVQMFAIRFFIFRKWGFILWWQAKKKGQMTWHRVISSVGVCMRLHHFLFVSMFTNSEIENSFFFSLSWLYSFEYYKIKIYILKWRLSVITEVSIFMELKFGAEWINLLETNSVNYWVPTRNF